MKYMLLIYMNEQAMNDSEREQCYVESTRLANELHAKGQYVTCSPLQPVGQTSVRSLCPTGPHPPSRETEGKSK